MSNSPSSQPSIPSSSVFNPSMDTFTPPDPSTNTSPPVSDPPLGASIASDDIHAATPHSCSSTPLPEGPDLRPPPEVPLPPYAERQKPGFFFETLGIGSKRISRKPLQDHVSDVWRARPEWATTESSWTELPEQERLSAENELQRALEAQYPLPGYTAKRVQGCRNWLPSILRKGDRLVYTQRTRIPGGWIVTTTKGIQWLLAELSNRDFCPSPFFFNWAFNTPEGPFLDHAEGSVFGESCRPDEGPGWDSVKLSGWYCFEGCWDDVAYGFVDAGCLTSMQTSATRSGKKGSSFSRMYADNGRGPQEIISWRVCPGIEEHHAWLHVV
ncbi:uncharacterized protein H6S33_008386 [Morchella sextelata]|uniref:uncharacterized protein n=1 Tax=Morchella sextelata TaxID=1174677 RepID=UPI001D05AAC3|nr:uncharacterized protein H6S33_008386 [Morchella sextelata]KAH0602736.1 hypothetical protein H6S33_008386 [Morchella sextelata]